LTDATTASTVPPVGGGRSRSTLLAALLLALHAALAWQGRAVGISTGNDDAWYLLLARALRRLTYTDFHVLGTPPHMQYPPGYPALIALLSAPFGERFDVLLGAMILLSVAALALVYAAVRQVSGEQVALAVLAICAVNPALREQAGFLASEGPFMLGVAATVWAVGRERADPRNARMARWWPVIASAAALSAAFMRAAGVTLVLGLLIFWLLERRYRRAAAFFAASAVSIGSWLTWSALAPVQLVGRSYIADATFSRKEGQHLLSTLAERAMKNIPGYLSTDLPWVVTQGTIPGTVIDNVIGLLLTLVLGGVGAWVLWRRARLVVVFLALYGALLALWPWENARFVAPVLPLLVWVAIEGAFMLARTRRWLRPAPFVIAGVVAVVGLTRGYASIRERAACDRSAPIDAAACYNEVQRAFFAAARFIAVSTPDSAVILTVREATLAYLTGRTIVMQEAIDDREPTAMLSTLRARGIDYTVLTPLREAPAQHVTALQGICGELELVREFHPVTLILAISPRNSTPQRNACSALRRYERDNGKWFWKEGK
jgi:4-amino-4-deoxy-L-arabinose transferase-like glycosyltransferase